MVDYICFAFRASGFKSFPQPAPVLGFVSFPHINDELPNIVNV